MKTKSPYALGLSVLLAFLISIPGDVLAAPQAAGQRAGEVSRVIPAVSIARSGEKPSPRPPRPQSIGKTS